MVEVRDQKMFGLDFRMQSGTIAQMRKLIAQAVVANDPIPTTGTQERVVPTSVHRRLAQRALSLGREKVHQQAPLELNNELGRAHGQAELKGWWGNEEVPRSIKGLFAKMAAVPHVRPSKVGPEASPVQTTRQRVLLFRRAGHLFQIASADLGGRGQQRIVKV